MESDSRVKGEQREISYASTLEFFSKRASRGSAVQQTTFQDHQPTLGEQRDTHETELILPKLSLGAQRRVLDIGCGSGRWAAKLDGRTAQYHGVDFADALIEIAENNAGERQTFQTLAAHAVSPDTLDLAPPFDTVLIVGVLMYLNDDDAESVIEMLPQLASPQAVIYLSEPVGLDDRLTLNDAYSRELEANYSAIYRTSVLYESWICRHLSTNGFVIAETGALYPERLRNRTETRQEYWLLQRP